MRSYPIIAREGAWIIAALAVGAIVTIRLAGPEWSVPWLLLLGLAVGLFRDPRRELPLAPLEVLAPVDGRVLDVGLCRSGLLERESLRVRIRVNPMGAYTLRAPIEGRILDPRDNVGEGSKLTGRGGMWLRSDEGDDVVVTFSGPAWPRPPFPLFRYGERVGHGQRSAFLRLVRTCEVYLPASVLPRVEAGQKVRAGQSTLARLRRGLDDEPTSV